jgi:hypothetical protein
MPPAIGRSGRYGRYRRRVADDDTGDTAGADEGPDPFEGLILDEEFIRGADVVEESAADRVVRRDAEYRRLAAQREAEARALEKQLRRNARRQRRASRGREHGQRMVVIAVMLAVFGGLVYWNVNHRGSSVALGSGLIRGDVTGGSIAGTERPPASVGAKPQPINSPPPVAVASPAHVFMQTQPGSADPVAYDPCRTIHVVMNERTVVDGGGALVAQALAAAHAATGLEFVVDGFTDEAPSENREPYQRDRYPGSWAPVLVAWSDPTETPELAGDVAGLGGSASLIEDKRGVYVTGSIELDGPDLAEILMRPDGQIQVRAIIEHEVGHLLGLDHVNDPTQLMNPSGNGSVTTYADGDLTGLNQLGRGACFPDV